MRGFDFTRAEEVYEFSERLLVGRLPERDSHAVIGVDLARELGVQPGGLDRSDRTGQHQEILYRGGHF